MAPAERLKLAAPEPPVAPVRVERSTGSAPESGRGAPDVDGQVAELERLDQQLKIKQAKLETFLDSLKTPVPADSEARVERARDMADHVSAIKAYEPELDRIDEEVAELDRQIDTKRLMREIEFGLGTMESKVRRHRGRVSVPL